MKRGNLFSIVFLLILTMGILSAIDQDTCSVVERSACDADLIMGLSGTTNAHGQLESIGTYDYVLCCKFPNPQLHICNEEGGHIISLYGDSNSHAETTDQDKYGVNICYGDFICRTGDELGCEEDEMGVLSLSHETNAHLGTFDSYPIKICCSNICGREYEYKAGVCQLTEQAYWANDGGHFIDETSIVADTTTLKLILAHSRAPIGTEVTFNVYKEGFFSFFGEEFTAQIKEEPDTGLGYAEIPWTVSTKQSGQIKGEKVFFDAEGEGLEEKQTSNPLMIQDTIIEEYYCDEVRICGSYETQFG